MLSANDRPLILTVDYDEYYNPEAKYPSDNRYLTFTVEEVDQRWTDRIGIAVTFSYDATRKPERREIQAELKIDKFMYMGEDYELTKLDTLMALLTPIKRSFARRKDFSPEAIAEMFEGMDIRHSVFDRRVNRYVALEELAPANCKVYREAGSYTSTEDVLAASETEARRLLFEQYTKLADRNPDVFDFRLAEWLKEGRPIAEEEEREGPSEDERRTIADLVAHMTRTRPEPEPEPAETVAEEEPATV